MPEGATKEQRATQLMHAVPKSRTNPEGLVKALQKLAEKHQRYEVPVGVFKRYYGIGFEPMTLDEVIADLGAFAGKGSASLKRQLVERELRKDEYWEE